MHFTFTFFVNEKVMGITLLDILANKKISQTTTSAALWYFRMPNAVATVNF